MSVSGCSGPRVRSWGFEDAVEEGGGLGEAANLAEAAGQLAKQREGFGVLGAECALAFCDGVPQGSLLGGHGLRSVAREASEAFFGELFNLSD